MKFIIHIITEDYNLITTIYSAFKTRFPQHDFDARKYTNKNNIEKKQLFEEQIEHNAFLNLRHILEVDKNVMDEKTDIVIGIGEGIKKDNYEDDENGVYFYGLIHLLMYYNNFMYSNESDKVYIKQEYNNLVNESQSDNKILFGENFKNKLNNDSINIDNWYVEMDPRKNKYILIENMINELLDNINLN